MQQSVKMKKPSAQNGPNMASVEKTGNLWNRNAGEAARDAVSLVIEINERLIINHLIFLPLIFDFSST